MFFKSTVLIICLLALAGSAVAITGQVTDAEKQPIPRVTVATNISAIGTIADENGKFDLTLSEEIKWVTFSAIGYQPRQFAATDLPATIVLQTQFYRGTDITVSANRAKTGEASIAFANLSAKDIERDYAYGEFPLLLNSTPNLHAYSDAGSAFGYSYIKIRGFDDKRISTYINGVPLNDPEDQATYFADLPDFASTATDIQIQRGVGNSLYGDGSFGGSINIVTNPFSEVRKTSITTGYGEYRSDGKRIGGIYRQNIEYNSGLIDGRWQYAGRFSKQASDGYRENSWYRGWSYYFSIGRLDPKMTTQFEAYGGPMKLHLSYYGVPYLQLHGSPSDSIEPNRRFNPLTYDNETDNFNQPHYQLTNRYRINENSTLTNTLYYIRGKGYYEQFKADRDFYEFNLDQTPGQTNGNLVSQQWVHKNQVGWNPQIDINHARGTHSFGGSIYFFKSDHWGQVVWIDPDDSTYQIEATPRQRYYQYFGKKQVGSIFARESYQLNDKLHGQLTLQLRNQRYQFDQLTIGAFSGIDYELDWLFFSPRAGLRYQLSSNTSLYGNFSISSRTPTDASIYDANDPLAIPSLDVKSERVFDYELGAEYRTSQSSLQIGLFYMDFYDEILPSGGLTDDGVPITINADRSIHTGVEFSGAWQPDGKISLNGNVSYNHNRIKEWGQLLDGFNIDFENKTIPFFPEYLANLNIDYNHDSYRVTLRSRYVGKQYGELLNIDSLSLDPYALFSVDLSYKVNQFFGLGNLTISGRVENLFDKKYYTSGYGGNYAWADGAAGGWAEYYPGSERSFYGQVRLELF